MNCSGLDFLRKIRDGYASSPSLVRLLGFTIVDVSEGRAAFEATPNAEYYNYAAIVHGGFTMALLDSALGSAVKSLLPAGGSYRTIDLHARLLRPIMEQTGTVRCEGRAPEALAGYSRRPRERSSIARAGCWRQGQPRAPFARRPTRRRASSIEGNATAERG